MRPGEPLLTVDGLGVAFEAPGGGVRDAARGVALEVRAGEVLALVGESGSGKSVTALSLLGLLPRPHARVTAGTATFRRRDGMDVDLLALDERTMRGLRGDDIAMVFQEPMTSLNPVMTVGAQIVEAVRLHRGLRGATARRAAIDAMRAVRIADASERFRAYPHQFSGGMRQRVMIAMALVCEPRLLIADEPTTALDVTVQAAIMDLLLALVRERGLGVLLITHDLGLVAERADHVCVMNAGRVLEAGPVADVLARPLHGYTRGLLACAPAIDGTTSRLVTIDPRTPGADAVPGVPGARGWWPGDGACVWRGIGPRRGVALRAAGDTLSDPV